MVRNIKIPFFFAQNSCVGFVWILCKIPIFKGKPLIVKKNSKREQQETLAWVEQELDNWVVTKDLIEVMLTNACTLEQ